MIAIRNEPSRSLTSRELATAETDFWLRLGTLKMQNQPTAGWNWYPYQSLGNFRALDLLAPGSGGQRDWLALFGEGPILDLGCGDGDNAFFFESLGFEVDAVDNPPTNYNQMEGVRTLKHLLGSPLQIHATDLDRQFSLPRPEYKAALVLGLLYHLKNPFYLLETLSRHVCYCFLSTRVARLAADGSTPIRDLPVAYLLAEGETNQDATNYWIFSEAGLRRLLERTNWEICELLTVGNTSDSDPVRPEGDERAYCIARSRYFRGFQDDVDLASGWHALEGTGYRWTAKRFTVRTRKPAEAVRLRLLLPEDVLAKGGPFSISSTVAGTAMQPKRISSSGEHLYTVKLPEHWAGGEISFEIDRVLPPSVDTRELGAVVLGIEVR